MRAKPNDAGQPQADTQAGDLPQAGDQAGDHLPGLVEQVQRLTDTVGELTDCVAYLHAEVQAAYKQHEPTVKGKQGKSAPAGRRPVQEEEQD